MYIVTGGAGFIGSAMVWKLNQMGIDDILVVDNLSTSEKWSNLVGLRYQDYLHRDQFLKFILEGDDQFETNAVIHMGACSSTTELDADFLMENNYRYTQYVCRFCLAHGARFINASSAATYGNGEYGFNDDHDGIDKLRPLNMYGYSKQLFDIWAKDSGILDQIVSLKFFNVFGPNEYHKDDMKSVICKAHKQILETGQLKLFKSYRDEYPHGGQKRDFVYIKDCVDIMAWFWNIRIRAASLISVQELQEPGMIWPIRFLLRWIKSRILNIFPCLNLFVINISILPRQTWASSQLLGAT